MTTDQIAKTYCELFNLKYEGTLEELFRLFDIDHFRWVHAQNYHGEDHPEIHWKTYMEGNHAI